jgi:hypothetical protein
MSNRGSDGWTAFRSTHSPTDPDLSRSISTTAQRMPVPAIRAAPHVGASRSSRPDRKQLGVPCGSRLDYTRHFSNGPVLGLPRLTRQTHREALRRRFCAVGPCLNIPPVCQTVCQTPVTQPPKETKPRPVARLKQLNDRPGEDPRDENLARLVSTFSLRRLRINVRCQSQTHTAAACRYWRLHPPHMGGEHEPERSERSERAPESGRTDGRPDSYERLVRCGSRTIPCTCGKVTPEVLNCRSSDVKRGESVCR